MNSGQKRNLFLAFVFGNVVAVIIFYLADFHTNIVSDIVQTSDFNDLQQWSRAIGSLIDKDKKRIELLMATKENQSIDEIRTQFYSVVNMPLQSFCTVGKIFGGIWLNHCGAMDGHKYVCLDKFYHDVLNKNCLIYSFGIANDWSFEEATSQLGCTVRAFDPTIDGKYKPKSNLISFEQIGLNNVSEEVKDLGQTLTLVDAVKKMGDTGKRISYLKVDVEGSELKVLPEWISSGILDHVDQFGIELHTGLVSIPNENLLTQLSNLMSIFRQLFAKGFRLISSMNNECVAKAQDSQGRYFNYFEIVFYKPDQGLL